MHKSFLPLCPQHPSIIEYIGLGAVDHSCPEAEWRTMYLVQEVRWGGGGGGRGDKA